MKNLKKLLKSGILILTIALLAVSCDKDDELKNDEANLPKIDLPVNSQKIDFINSQHYGRLSEQINSINLKLNTNRTQSKNITEDLTIVLEDVLYTEYNSSHTYTFKILREHPIAYVENLVLHYNIDNQGYDEYLVQYNITADEFVELSNNGQLQSSEDVAITTLEQGFFDSNTFSKNCERVCNTIYVDCSSGAHHAGNIDQWTNCTEGQNGGTLPRAYQSCTSSCPTIDAGSSGGGGGSGTGSGGGGTGNGNVITNPNTNEPCVTGRGTTGISGNDGCITTMEDEARNQLFDRLVNYMSNQDQADWIVLEAEIEFVNTSNSFLDGASFNNQSHYNQLAVSAIDNHMSFNSSNYPGMEDGLTFNWWNNGDFIINSGDFDIDEQQPNAKEIAVYALFPGQALLHVENSNTALDKALELVSNGTLTGIGDGKADAFRHAFWNALGTAEFGSEVMKLFADAHEWGESGLSVTMDFYNNHKGRVIGENFNFSTNESTISTAVLQAVFNGTLKYINSSGVLITTNL
jgi:hypothetical protein